MRPLIIVFTAIPFVFMAVGAWQAIEQGRRMKRYVVADGQVVDPPPRVDSSNWLQSRDHSPIVHYQYQVGGTTYHGERVFPMLKGIDTWRASEIVAANKVGTPVKVHHDPKNPAKSFLVRRWDFWPYLYILAPMVYFSLGIGLWGAGLVKLDTPAVEVASRDGWTELPIQTGVRKKQMAWSMIAAAWWAVGLLALGHYFLSARGAYETDAMFYGGIYMAVGLLPLFLATRYWMITRNAADARAFVDKREVYLGDVINVTTEQVFHRALLIRGLDLGLVLERTEERRPRGSDSTGKTEKHVSTLWESWGKEVVRNEQSTTGRPLKATHRFEIPTDQPATRGGTGDYPSNEWRVVMRVRIDGAPDYYAAFPIQVRAK